MSSFAISMQSKMHKVRPKREFGALKAKTSSIIDFMETIHALLKTGLLGKFAMSFETKEPFF